MHGTTCEGHTLYVKAALKKGEREVEKKKDMMRFKNSKKRCNLHVKNFLPTTTKEHLEALFGQCGEIESVKLMPNEGEAQYAFVCFKSPESASSAKAKLHGYNMNGKQLLISHYEIKELRQAQQEEMRDKNDFQNYMRQNISGNPAELLNKPETLNLLSMLFNLMQQKQGGNGGAPFQGRPNYPRQGGQRP